MFWFGWHIYNETKESVKASPYAMWLSKDIFIDEDWLLTIKHPEYRWYIFSWQEDKYKVWPDWKFIKLKKIYV